MPPSCGCSSARSAEWMPSAPTSASPRTDRRPSPSQARGDAAGILRRRRPADAPVRSAPFGSRRSAARHSMPCSRPRWTENCGSVWPACRPARLGPERLAEVVQVAQLPRADGDGIELRQQPELRPFRDAMRQVVDADAELPHLRRRLQHGAGDAPPFQHQRQGQPPDAAACDQNLHPRPSPNRHPADQAAPTALLSTSASISASA